MSTDTYRAEDLTKLTVNLIPSAMAALDHAAALTGDTRTDCVNRALQVYVVVTRLMDEPGHVAEMGLTDGPFWRISVKRSRWYHRLFRGRMVAEYIPENGGYR